MVDRKQSEVQTTVEDVSGIKRKLNIDIPENVKKVAKVEME